VRDTYLNQEATRRLRQGIPWVYRDEILRIEGPGEDGEPVRLVDEEGRPLGLGDLDLASSFAVRRLALAGEAPEGVIQRHMRQAIARRAQWVDDPRFCRLIHDDGDGLPGLLVDRFDDHYSIQTLTRAMDARVEEIARSLVELAGANSVLLRNDSDRRERAGLPVERPHVLHGTPPRWSRVFELRARFTVDLFSGLGTGYFYDLRQVRRRVARMSDGARVLDLGCFVGGLFVHAGLHGARQILAFDKDFDAVELARENAEANGLMRKVKVQQADMREALAGLDETFDLVFLDLPLLEGEHGAEDRVSLIQQAMKATRHGGRLVVLGYDGAVDASLAKACEKEGRLALRLARVSLPSDFPTVVGTPGAEYLSGEAVELS
jgi:23S rRNA (cytosine1962-C5)-methyltransferase